MASLELGAGDSIDVFEDDEAWTAFPDSLQDVGEEVAGILIAMPLSGLRERLARKSAREDVKSPVKSSVGEGFKIRPYNALTQGSAFNLLRQVVGGECFDLHMNSEARTDACEFQSEVDSSVSGTQRKVRIFLGSIHIFVFLFLFHFRFSYAFR